MMGVLGVPAGGTSPRTRGRPAITVSETGVLVNPRAVALTGTAPGASPSGTRTTLWVKFTLMVVAAKAPKRTCVLAGSGFKRTAGRPDFALSLAPLR